MKGVFYSVMALMLLLPIVSYLVLYSDVIKSQNEELAQRITGEKLASFSKSINIDLKKALNIYARRSIGNAVAHIETNGTPIDNSNLRLKELFMNNTIYGSTAPLNSSIYEWRDKIIIRGNQLGFDTTINFTEISFIPYDSFNIVLNTSVIVNITAGDTTVYRHYDESIMVSIEDYEDPLYTLNTNGLVKNIIKKSSFSVTNVTHLDNLTSRKLYISSSDGASFFDRLEGRLTSSAAYKAMSSNTIGMESIVYQPDLLAFGITPKTGQSYVDYLYFDSSAIIGYPVNNSAISWLRIDDVHIDLYDVEKA